MSASASSSTPALPAPKSSEPKKQSPSPRTPNSHNSSPALPPSKTRHQESYDEEIDENLGSDILTDGSLEESDYYDEEDESMETTESIEEDHRSQKVAPPALDMRISQLGASTDDSRNADFQKLFNVPQEERIVEDFSCAYYKKMIHQGRMYISQNYVCFNSNLLLIKNTFSIHFKEITKIERKTTAFVVPNAIEITTKDNTYFFGSFLFRDHTFTILDELWKIHHKMKGASVQPVEEEEEEESEFSVTESPTASTGEGDLLSEVEEDLDQALPQNTLPESGSGSVETSSKSNMDHNNTNVSSETSSSQTKNEQNTNNGTNTNDQGSEKELKDDNVDYEDFDDVPGTDLFHSKDDLQFEEVANETFPISAKAFWDMVFSDGNTLEIQMHEAEEETDINRESWKPGEDGYGIEREKEFTSPTKAPFGPKYTKIISKQRRLVFGNGTKMLVQISNNSLDVPYGKSFRIETRLEVEAKSSKECTVRVYVGVYFLESVMWKGRIQSSGMSRSRETLDRFLNGIKERIASERRRSNRRKKPSRQAQGRSARHKHAHRSKNRSSRRPGIRRSGNGGEGGSTGTVSKLSGSATSSDPRSRSASSSDESILSTIVRISGSVISSVMEISLSTQTWIVLGVLCLSLLIMLPIQFHTISRLYNVEHSVMKFESKAAQFEKEISGVLLHLSDTTERLMREGVDQAVFDVDVLDNDTMGRRTEDQNEHSSKTEKTAYLSREQKLLQNSADMLLKLREQIHAEREGHREHESTIEDMMTQHMNYTKKEMTVLTVVMVLLLLVIVYKVFT